MRRTRPRLFACVRMLAACAAVQNRSGPFEVLLGQTAAF